VGTGSAAGPSFNSSTNVVTNVAGLPGHLMYVISKEQDINCRTFWALHLRAVDRQRVVRHACRDATPDCDDKAWLQAPHKPLAEDLGREFLYACYNVDLSREGLDCLGCQQPPGRRQKLDSVDHVDDLLAFGAKAGELDVAHFGNFA
jgi:hypothetical protein